MKFEELSSDEIVATEASPPTTPTRKKKEVVLERTVAGWFKLSHTRISECGNEPDCIDPRPKPENGNPTLMVYEMPDGVQVCRYCYVGGYGA